MRILLDQAVHDHRNKGNNALLEAALYRLRRYWPAASYDIISIAPHFCRVYFPGTHPVSYHDVCPITGRFDAVHRFTPRPLLKGLFELRRRLEERNGTSLSAERLRMMVRSGSDRGAVAPDPAVDALPPTEGFEDTARPVAKTAVEKYRHIAGYDLYVCTGGGYMCDSDRDFLFQMFDRLEAAVAYGVPAVMVSQGIGPLEDPALLARAAAVLPHIDYIMIREERVARPLLDSLKVPRGNVLMTGDDAIEPAFQLRRPRPGTGIGVSLRVASYTQVSMQHIADMRPVVRAAAAKYGATLVTAPIDINDADLAYIEAIVGDSSVTSGSWRRFESTPDLIKRIGRCRVMITGTFHAAVFALGQGIPVVALAKSVEYHNKIMGLQTEFGAEGVQIVDLSRSDMQQVLAEAIDAAWLAAERLRPHLLAQAERQIALGYAAYQNIFELVAARQQAAGWQAAGAPSDRTVEVAG